MSQATNTLTQKEGEALRRWVKKINNNTWEIREHPYQRVLVAFFLACWFIGALTIVPIMQSDSGSKFEHKTWHSGWDSVIENIETTLMPSRVMEKEFLLDQDKRNLGFTRDGEARDLTNEQAKKLSHWFTPIDDGTIELRGKWGGGGRLIVLLSFFLISTYWNFINTKYREDTLQRLAFTFQPDTQFEKAWLDARDFDNPNLSRWGETKEEFKAAMSEEYKDMVWASLPILLPYLLILLACSLPMRWCMRFDRKRGIIYTYDRGKLHVTEINKLMRPLSEWMRLDIYGVSMWVHPYIRPKGIRAWGRWSGKMTFSDASIWWYFFTWQFQKSQMFFMQSVIVEFMNPDIAPERLAELKRAIAKKPHWSRFFLTWIEMGPYCKRLPKQAVLEEKLATYFNEVAPTIDALPSWYYVHKSKERVWAQGSYYIVSVEKNKQAEFDKVPCPTLFEIPEQSMHADPYTSIEYYREAYNKKNQSTE